MDDFKSLRFEYAASQGLVEPMEQRLAEMDERLSSFMSQLEETRRAFEAFLLDFEALSISISYFLLLMLHV